MSVKKNTINKDAKKQGQIVAQSFTAKIRPKRDLAVV